MPKQPPPKEVKVAAVSHNLSTRVWEVSYGDMKFRGNVGAMAAHMGLLMVELDDTRKQRDALLKAAKKMRVRLLPKRRHANWQVMDEAAFVELTAAIAAAETANATRSEK